MSRFADEIATAYSRWRSQNSENVAPVVRVSLTNGRTLYFNGIAVAPVGASPAAVTLSSAGLNVTTLIVRDADIFAVEIEAVT